WHGLTIQACGATDQVSDIDSPCITVFSLNGGISSMDARTLHFPFISVMPILAIHALTGGISSTDARTLHIPFISVMPILAIQALNGGISSMDARMLHTPNISHSLTPSLEYDPHLQ
ncbi:hypothetical protein P692DRAFT_20739877, partial [Suillus brevipes Sb2]